MPTYSIDGPDGKTYSIDGPEGATREQVISAIKSKMTSPQQSPAAPQENGVVDTIKKYAPPVARGLVGLGAGMADLATTVPYNAVQEIGHRLDPSKPARDIPSISDAAQKGLTQMGLPESQTGAQKAVQYGTEFLAGGGAGAIKDIAKGGVAAAKYATNGAKLIEDLTKAKNIAYSAAKSFTTLHPEDKAELVKALKKIEDVQTESGQAANPDVVREIQSIEGTKKVKGGTVTNKTSGSVNNLLQARKNLNDSQNAAAREAGRILDKYIKNPAVRARAIGNPADFEAFDRANQLNRQLESTKTFLEVLNKEDAPAIKKALKSIQNNPYQMRLYPKNIQDLIVAGAKGKTSGNILQAAGSLRQWFNGNTTAGRVAGGVLGLGEAGAVAAGAGTASIPALAGAAGLYGASALARRAATNISKGDVADILDAISKGM